ncbi:Pr6Pr family membrane protein [Ottowia thiooxydans]|uniref:Pr6Pr family membrane protein n=1 Tax=Ottowia thiooxydans TaxID=219182 RepID=UPI00041DBA48|nr:Pr6Pr family membrane protein [Ottowia thiooxydans]
MNPTPLTAVLRLAFALLALAAIGWQLSLHVGLNYSVLNFFSYFTNLSNLLAVGVLIAGACRQWMQARPSAAFESLRAVTTTCMLVVGVVFALLLRDVDLGALSPWVNSVVHHVMPVVVLLDWLLWPPRPAVGLRPLRWVVAFAALYLAYSMVRGAVVEWYPYPFLNPANVGGYGGVAMYAVGIAAIVVVSGWALLAWASRRVRVAM